MKHIYILIMLFTFSQSMAREGKQLIELIRKGNAQHDVGNYDQAITIYKKALKLDSISGLVQYEIAYTLLAMKNYDEAAEYSRKVIELDGKQQQGAYLMLGSALNMSGKLQDAITVYLQGLKKFPSLHQLHYNLALAYYDIGNLNRAEEALQRSLQMRPGHVNSHVLLGKLYQARGDVFKAVLCFTYVLYLDSELHNAAEIEQLVQTNVAVMMNNSTDSLSIGRFQGDSLFAHTYQELNVRKSSLQENSNFSQALCAFFGSMRSLSEKGHPLWSDLYAHTFYGMQSSGHCEAFAYSILSMNPNNETDSWMRLNQAKIQDMRSWIDTHQPPQKMNQILFGGTSVFR